LIDPGTGNVAGLSSQQLGQLQTALNTGIQSGAFPVGSYINSQGVIVGPNGQNILDAGASGLPPGLSTTYDVGQTPDQYGLTPADYQALGMDPNLYGRASESPGTDRITTTSGQSVPMDLEDSYGLTPQDYLDMGLDPATNWTASTTLPSATTPGNAGLGYSGNVPVGGDSYAGYGYGYGG